MLYSLLFFLLQSANCLQNNFTKQNFTKYMNSDRVEEGLFIKCDSFPHFNLPDRNNNVIELYKIKPKFYSIIILWKSDHVLNKNELKNLYSLYGKYHNRISFVFIFIGDNHMEWKNYIEKFGFNGINLIDTNNVTGKKLKIHKFPSFYLLSNDFTILEKSENLQLLIEKLENYYFINDGLNIKNKPSK